MKRVYTDKKKRSYAVYGLGSTRLAIALANYYCSYLKKKVVIGEVGSGGMSDISTDTFTKTTSFVKGDMVGFARMKVDYCPNLSEDEAIHLLEEDVDVVILDFKIISHDYMNLFRLCNRRLFLSSIAIYNRREFCSRKNLFDNDMVEVEIYCYCLSKRDRTWYEEVYKNSKYSTTVKDAPIIRNPDRLTRDDIHLLSRIGC